MVDSGEQPRAIQPRPQRGGAQHFQKCNSIQHDVRFRIPQFSCVRVRRSTFRRPAMARCCEPAETRFVNHALSVCTDRDDEQRECTERVVRERIGPLRQLRIGRPMEVQRELFQPAGDSLAGDLREPKRDGAAAVVGHERGVEMRPKGRRVAHRVRRHSIRTRESLPPTGRKPRRS